MKTGEFINSLHNTIDLNKKLICEAVKNGTQEISLWFTIKPDEPVKFEIMIEKTATKSFKEMVPFLGNIEGEK